jgi:sugar phosphate isomerase/epimerase
MLRPAGHTDDPRPNLAATVAPLLVGADGLPLRESLAWLSKAGFRGVQLSATDPATRPRELDRSARRDLSATLARHELACSGLDFFIPPAHYTDAAHLPRALDALEAAIELGGDLGRVPVVVSLPGEVAAEVLAHIGACSARAGVAVLQCAAGAIEKAWSGAGIGCALDCAAALGAGGAPEALVARLGNDLGGLRLVDLTRSGMRAPILEPGESRLDALALRIALELARFERLPVADARQWLEPRAGLSKTLARWRALAV